MGQLIGTSAFFRPGPPALIGEASESVMKFILKNVKGKVLDLGGGRGAYAHALQQKGFDVSLGEIDPDCIASATAIGLKAIDTLSTPWEELKGAYDTVMLIEVLEHVKDYQVFLENALACTKETLILTVPCNDDFEELFKANLTYNHIAVSDHINHFTSESMQALLMRLGLHFKIVKGDFLFGATLVPLIYNKLKWHPLGVFLAIPLKILCRFGWVPKLFPSRLFVVITKPKDS